jgi:hypothetical protein
VDTWYVSKVTRGGRETKPSPHLSIQCVKNRENRARNVDSSFLSVDEIGNIVPKTPEAALVAAQAYLLTTQPTPRDPREGMHQAAIKGLGLTDPNHQGKKIIDPNH